MTATAQREKLVGQRLKRREDPRLIQGQARFMDDIKLAGMAHVKLLRSPVAHARIRSVDTSRAASAPGVIAVYTGQDFASVNALPYAWQAAGVDNFVNTPRILAVDEVHWVGDPIAAVVAETPGQAVDALELIQIDFETLPAVVDAEKTTHAGAPQLHENATNNIAFTWQCGNAAGTDEAIANAEVHISQRLRNQRLIATPIETRGAIGQYDAGTDEYTFWLSSQAPHVHRLVMAAFVLGHPEEKIRVIAPDIGGAFGSKIFMYTEYPLVGLLAKQLGRTVKWIETREEHALATAQGRDHVTDLEVAATHDGKITGLKVTTWANLGAYLSTAAGGIPTTLYGRMLSGVYKIPNIHCTVHGTYTNTALVDAYRGAGRPEAAYVIERAVDLVAGELGLDPTEVRRKNFIPSDEFPFDTGIGMLPYDSGNYPAALDRALEIIGYSDLRREQEDARGRGKHLGVGFSTYVEVCGVAPTAWVMSEGWAAGLWESANIKVHLTGKVVVTTGTMPHGQGHETTFAQMVSDGLGVPYDDIVVEWGDTSGTPFGYGSYGSRSLVVGGTALTLSIEKIRDKMKKIAAHMLEVNEDEVDLEAGTASVKGAPDRSVGFGDIAATAAVGASLPAGVEPFLDATSYFDPVNCTFPFGTHIAVVEVDDETGNVVIQRYVAVDDVGNAINPLIVDGQVQGGIVQGIGQALWESGVYGENGELLSSTLMDYGIPKAGNLPMFELDRTVTTTNVNPMGAKGAGEAGTIASTPAIVNAVMDALAPLGIKHIDMPLSAPRVWAAMQEAKVKGS
jgi:carbon-monoxide dehydrogenase large subunit